MENKSKTSTENQSEIIAQPNRWPPTIWRVSKLEPLSKIAERAGNQKLFDYLKEHPREGARFFYDLVWEGDSNRHDVLGEARLFGTGLYIAIERAPKADVERQSLLGCWKIIISETEEPDIQRVVLPGPFNSRDVNPNQHIFWERNLAIYVWGKENNYEKEWYQDYGLVDNEKRPATPYIYILSKLRKEYYRQNGYPHGNAMPKNDAPKMWDMILGEAANLCPNYREDILSRTNRKMIQDQVRGYDSSKEKVRRLKRSNKKGKEK